MRDPARRSAAGVRGVPGRGTGQPTGYRRCTGAGRTRQSGARARQQALVPVALSADGRTLVAWPVIEGDQPSPMGDQVMTFTSYHVEQDIVVATVKRLDGTAETRRYRQGGMFGPWERF